MHYLHIENIKNNLDRCNKEDMRSSYERAPQGTYFIEEKFFLNQKASFEETRKFSFLAHWS